MEDPARIQALLKLGELFAELRTRHGVGKDYFLMKAALGRCRQVKKLISQQSCLMEIELPIESLKDAVMLFDSERVLVTLSELEGPDGILEATEPSKPDKPIRRHWSNLTPAAQAGILCRDPTFWRHLSDLTQVALGSEEECVGTLGHYLGIESRSELNSGRPKEAWRDLMGQFEAQDRYGDMPETQC